MRYVIVLVCASFLITGCNVTNNKALPPPDNINHNVRVKQTVPVRREIRNPERVADRLERLAVSVPKVKEATCVVIGNTAIVGVNVEGDMDRSHVGTVKYSVAEALRKDPYGANAVVTADLDIGNRLREIQREIRRGRPISGFAKELGDIVGRIMPQFPKDITPMDNPPGRTEDRNQLKNKSLII